MDARQMTSFLRGEWHSGYGTAPCPVCQPDAKKEQTALTLADSANGRLLANCKRLNCAFIDILAAAGITAGDYQRPDEPEIARREAERRAEANRKAAQAQACWAESWAISDTPADTYLRRRGINAPLPHSLRYHPRAWHGATATTYPAMIARVDGGGGAAVHRTYLRPDGSGKATIAPNKAMLGAVAGGAVKLTEGAGPLVVTEGIETGLSLASGLLSGSHTVWAALSTSGMKGLRLPSRLGSLIVAADGDRAGREASEALAERAHALGWEVSLLPAPEGKDWNDVLTQEVAA